MIKLLLKLQSNTLKWGVMNAEQMLSYCLSQMQFAFGELKLISNLFMRIIGKIYKNKVVQAPRFKKNNPTFSEFVCKGQFDFEKTRVELIHTIRRFAEQSQSVFKTINDPLFGKMTY